MNRPIAMAVCGLALALGAVACVGGSKGGGGLTAEEKERLKPYILEAEPAGIEKTEINFEGKFHIIGYKVEPSTAPPGTEVKLTYYWKVDDTIEPGWNLFTHVHDPQTGRVENLDWNGPLRENKDNQMILGPSKWERGKIYVDEQTYKVPADTKSPELEVLVGVWKGNARLRVTSGPTDGDNRGIVLKVKTGLTPPPPAHSELPSVIVSKLAANQKIVIDGKGDDDAWKAAPVLGPFVDVGTGEPGSPFPVQGSAKLAWDDQNLYLLGELSSEDVLGGWDEKAKKPDEWTTTGQPKAWIKECLELMIDPDGDGDNKDYYELQFTPQNKLFRTQYDAYNEPKKEPNGPFGHEDWDPKLKSAVVVKGTIDKSDDKDEGWTVEVAIPWAAFSKAKNHPPKSGDTWRMNLYAMKQNAGVAWSPIRGKGNFHFAPQFGKVAFVDPATLPKPPPPGVDPAAAPPGVGGPKRGRGATVPGAAPKP